MIDSSPTSPPASRCLTPGDFDALARAVPADALFQQAEQHLQQCRRCAQQIDQWGETSDVLLQGLSALGLSADDEPELQDLQRRLLDHPVEVDSDLLSATLTGNFGRVARPQVEKLPAELGQYVLLACIGRGASGAVYRARHKKLDKTVAVKVLDADSRAGALSLARFQDEMKSTGRLAHPNIIRATDAGEANGLHFLVMEYAAGVDASRLLRLAGPLNANLACEIIRQAALGLQFAHDHGLVHRDVKPANLLVTVAGEVKLLDLGIAAQATPGWTSDKPQAIVGTAQYMAPEQWLDEAVVDARTDVYGLGCTLLRLLTGRLPAITRGDGATRLAHARQILAETRPAAPRQLIKYLLRMIAPEPDDRPATAADVARRMTAAPRQPELSQLVVRFHGGEAPRTPSDASAATPTSRWTRRAAIAAAAASLAGAWTNWSSWLAPELQRNRWRPLRPDQPPVWTTLNPDFALDYDPQANRFEIESSELTLIRLGRPVVDQFRLRVDLQQDQWPGNVGIFFNAHMRVETNKESKLLASEGEEASLPASWEFQSLELRPRDPDAAQNVRRLLWSQWRVVRRDGRVEAQREPWAEAVVKLDRAGEVQCLEASFGQTGMPEVRWNKGLVHVNRWKFSTAGRRRQSLSAEHLPRAFLGRLGLLNLQGANVFLRPELAYL